MGALVVSVGTEARWVSGVIRYDSGAPAHSDLCPFVYCYVGAADRGEMNAKPRAFPVQVESDAVLVK